jgi:hypothetical protein
VNNGALLKVRGFTPTGDIRIGLTRVIPKEFAHIDHGYCLTSHSSQAKTVDEVLVSMPAESLGAASVEQFYVSVTRGRDRVTVYTDNKQELMKWVSRTSERESAMEMTADNPHQERNGVLNPVLERAREAAAAAARRFARPTPTIDSRAKEREAERA